MQLLFAVFCQILSLVSSGVSPSSPPLQRSLSGYPCRIFIKAYFLATKAQQKIEKPTHRKISKYLWQSWQQSTFCLTTAKKGYIEKRSACKSFHLRKTGNKYAQPKRQSKVGKNALKVLLNYLIPWLKHTSLI